MEVDVVDIVLSVTFLLIGALAYHAKMRYMPYNGTDRRDEHEQPHSCEQAHERIERMLVEMVRTSQETSKEINESVRLMSGLLEKSIIQNEADHRILKAHMELRAKNG